MISVDWTTRIISVPLSYLTLVSGTIYELDTDQFRLDLKALEDDPDQGMPYPQTHTHNTEVTLAGLTLARTVEIINGYTVEFEDGAYRVSLVGSNNNIADVTVVNNVSIQTNNSAGLITVNTTGGATAAEVWDHVLGDGIVARNALLGCFQALLNNSTIVTQPDNSNIVTIFADDGTTAAYQFSVSEDGKVRTRL